MYWWAWIAVGAILFGAELAFVDAQFYLVFVGAAALVTGSLRLLGLDLAVWLQWLVFAILAAGSMVFFRGRIYERLRYEGYLRCTEEYHDGQKCAGYRITDLGRSELQQSKEALACLR